MGLALGLSECQKVGRWSSERLSGLVVAGYAARPKTVA
jgi:hypothetical protein